MSITFSIDWVSREEKIDDFKRMAEEYEALGMPLCAEICRYAVRKYEEGRNDAAA